MRMTEHYTYTKIKLSIFRRTFTGLLPILQSVFLVAPIQQYSHMRHNIILYLIIIIRGKCLYFITYSHTFSNILNSNVHKKKKGTIMRPSADERKNT